MKGVVQKRRIHIFYLSIFDFHYYLILFESPTVWVLFGWRLDLVGYKHTGGKAHRQHDKIDVF